MSGTVGGIVVTRHAFVSHETLCLTRSGKAYADNLYNLLSAINKTIVTDLGQDSGKFYADDASGGRCTRCVDTVAPLQQSVGDNHVIHRFATGKGCATFNQCRIVIPSLATWMVICVRYDDYNAILEEMSVQKQSSYEAYQHFWDIYVDSDQRWKINRHDTDQLLPSEEELAELEAKYGMP